ncbi:MAG TPA: phosphomannomutase CpsG, partial [Ignavibacteriaceae bacterium]|nr:phosphomannomutase CpsG [Ignavibacteriaceae bacterium]
MDKITSFKAYDIRGKVPSELSVDLAYKIGRTYAHYINAKKVVIGYDVRKSSNELSKALAQGLTE